MTESKGEYDLLEVPVKDDVSFFISTVGASKPSWIIDSFKRENQIRENWFTVQEGDVVLDVGAGYGSYTLWALALGASQVVAWEPDKEDLFCLHTNLVHNEFKGKCEILPALAGGAYGIHDLYFPVTHSLVRGEGTPERRLVIPVDDVVRGKNLSKVDFIKIDVEGSEAWVLEGSQETLKKFSPQVIIEVHNEFDSEIKDKVHYLMESCGYRLDQTAIMDHPMIRNDWELWKKA